MTMEKLVKDWRGKPKYSEKTCPNVALSTTNPTCCPDANPSTLALGQVFSEYFGLHFINFSTINITYHLGLVQ
jgi:hypothetical protein